MGSSIEWTDETWNPVRGCTKISPGCKHCYAETFAERFRGVPGHPYERGFDLRLVPDALDKPMHWKKPRKVFVNSMSDLFHKSVPFEFIEQVFAVMANCPQHTFQALTKRADRMRQFFEHLGPFGLNVRGSAFRMKLNDSFGWPLPNVWIGVSVENQECADKRIPDLLATPAAVRFLSVEPMLGPVELDATPAGDALSECDCRGKGCDACMGLGRIDWVIVGGESGPGARPFDLAWARSIVAQCQAAGVPVFVKQLGDFPTAALRHEALDARWKIEQGGRLRMVLANHKGGDPAEWPEDLRVREYPR